MIVALIIAIYLFTCWLSYRIFIDAWTFEFDADRQDVRTHKTFSIAGPISLLAAVAIWIEAWSDDRHRRNFHPRDNDIIYPRKDTQ